MSDLLGIGSLISAGIGAAQHASDMSQAEQNYMQAVAEFQKLGVPTAQAQQLALQHLKSVGQLTPQLEQTINQGKSNLSSITTDPAEKQAQLKALSTLQTLGTNGGELLSDKAALQNTLNQTATQARGAREAILANANARGQLGSGQSLTAQLDNAQKAANANQSAALDINGEAQKRALQAIMQSGDLAGKMRSQDYSEKANAASAQDAIDRFNTANKQNTSNTNIGIQNDAQKYNLANNQRIADTNATIDNYQQERNQGLIQQEYEDQLQKAAGETGQLDKMGQFDENSAQQASNMWGNIAGGLGKAWAATSGSSNKSNSGSGSSDFSLDNYAGSWSPNNDDDEIA